MKINKVSIDFTSVFHALFITFMYISVLCLMSGYNFLGLMTLSNFINVNEMIIHKSLIIIFISILILESILVAMWIMLNKKQSNNKSNFKKYLIQSIVILALVGAIVPVCFIGQSMGADFGRIMSKF